MGCERGASFCWEMGCNWGMGKPAASLLVNNSSIFCLQISDERASSSFRWQVGSNGGVRHWWRTQERNKRTPRFNVGSALCDEYVKTSSFSLLGWTWVTNMWEWETGERLRVKNGQVHDGQGDKYSFRHVGHQRQMSHGGVCKWEQGTSFRWGGTGKGTDDGWAGTSFCLVRPQVKKSARTRLVSLKGGPHARNGQLHHWWALMNRWEGSSFDDRQITGDTGGFAASN